MTTSWFNKFWRKQDNTAQVAKDRLQIIVARERAACGIGAPGYLPALQQELLQVIAKYERVDLDLVNVNIDRRGQAEVLELSVLLPENEPNDAAKTVRGGILFA
jgi:cell division topological specificity factor